MRGYVLIGMGRDNITCPFDSKLAKRVRNFASIEPDGNIGLLIVGVHSDPHFGLLALPRTSGIQDCRSPNYCNSNLSEAGV
ncbi:hypothetical protein D3C73_1522550 [compost metagenome]